MTEEDIVSRMDVLKHELAVEFCKLTARPLDLDSESDFAALLELLPDYHDGPRNSPSHLYAALADEGLLWRRTEIPVAQLIRGPGDDGLEMQAAVEAEGYTGAFGLEYAPAMADHAASLRRTRKYLTGKETPK